MTADLPTDDYESALAGWAGVRPPAAPAQPAEEDDGDLLPGGRKKAAANAEALERVKEWTRARFKLPPDAAIMVSELECKIPGCAPLETAVAFWDAEGTRYHFKLMKPVTEVTEDNLPFAWMKESLILAEGFGCECC
jgi:nitrate reductase delta subunit